MGLRERAIAQKEARAEDKQERAERDTNPDQTWEYKARNLAKVPGMALEDDFNELGQRGWEFVAMATGGSEGYAIFKRRVH